MWTALKEGMWVTTALMVIINIYYLANLKASVEFMSASKNSTDAWVFVENHKFYIITSIAYIVASIMCIISGLFLPVVVDYIFGASVKHLCNNKKLCIVITALFSILLYVGVTYKIISGA